MEQQQVPLLSSDVIEACASGNGLLLKKLISAGVVFDVEAYRKWYHKCGKNPHLPDCKESVIMRQLIRIAAINKHESIVDWLLCYVYPDAERAAEAIELGSPEALELFIELDPFLPLRARYHTQTLLFVSLPLPEWKAMQGVEILLKHGANPNFPSNFIYGAIKAGNPRFVALLDAYGAKPDETELISPAAGSRSIKLVQYLLDCGADINRPSDAQTGWTALHRAAANADTLMIEFLMKHGADATVKDANGKLAIDFANALEDLDLRNIIVELLSFNEAN